MKRVLRLVITITLSTLILLALHWFIHCIENPPKDGIIISIENIEVEVRYDYLCNVFFQSTSWKACSAWNPKNIIIINPKTITTIIFGNEFIKTFCHELGHVVLKTINETQANKYAQKCLMKVREDKEFRQKILYTFEYLRCYLLLRNKQICQQIATELVQLDDYLYRLELQW